MQLKKTTCLAWLSFSWKTHTQKKKKFRFTALSLTEATAMNDTGALLQSRGHQLTIPFSTVLRISSTASIFIRCFMFSSLLETEGDNDAFKNGFVYKYQTRYLTTEKRQTALTRILQVLLLKPKWKKHCSCHASAEWAARKWQFSSAWKLLVGWRERWRTIGWRPRLKDKRAPETYNSVRHFWTCTKTSTLWM